MAISSANAQSAPATRRVETLTSGTSWTVPAGISYVNATLVGGGGGGMGTRNSGGVDGVGSNGTGGQVITTSLAVTSGASITYAIGAGGSGGGINAAGSSGGNTTFTGATSAAGGTGGNAGATQNGINAGNFGVGSGTGTGNSGGSGQIILEYFLQEMIMKKFAVIENNKVVNIIVGVEEEVVMAHPDMFIEYTDGNWDYNNGIDGGVFFPKPVTE